MECKESPQMGPPPPGGGNPKGISMVVNYTFKLVWERIIAY